MDMTILNSSSRLFLKDNDYTHLGGDASWHNLSDPLGTSTGDLGWLRRFLWLGRFLVFSCWSRASWGPKGVGYLDFLHWSCWCLHWSCWCLLKLKVKLIKYHTTVTFLKSHILAVTFNCQPNVTYKVKHLLCKKRMAGTQEFCPL